jgi:hypothetical protein
MHWLGTILVNSVGSASPESLKEHPAMDRGKCSNARQQLDSCPSVVRLSDQVQWITRRPAVLSQSVSHLQRRRK